MGNAWSSTTDAGKSTASADRRGSKCYAEVLDARDAAGWTRLMRQVRDGDLPEAKRLLVQRASVDAAGVGGLTPLMVAASIGSVDAAVLLLAHGASVAAVDKFGKTPLMLAARYGHTAVACVLLGGGADVNAQDRDGHSPLMFGAESGHVDVVAFLVTENVALKIDAVNKNGWTALTFACCEGNWKIAWFLLANFTAVDALDRSHRSPLMVAVQNGHLDVAELLLLAREPNGADASLVDKADNSVLVTLLGSYWNLKRGEAELLPLVSLLLDNGADPCRRNTDGVSAVTVALQKRLYAVLGQLLDRSVRLALHPVAIQPREKWTPRPNWEPETEPEASSFLLSFTRSEDSVQPPASSGLGQLERRDLSMCDPLLLAHLRDRLDDLPSAVDHSAIRNRFKASSQALPGHVPAILRLVRARVAAEVASEFHFAIDQANHDGVDWHTRWDADCKSVRRRIVQCARANAMRDAVTEISDPLDQELALTLLVHEASHESSCYSATELALLRALTSRLANFAHLALPAVEDWFIPAHEVELSALIAVGGFGKVYRGTWLKTDVAVKCVRIESLEDYHTFLREVRVWHCAQHRHVVRFYGACHVGPACFVVCEYASNGSLVVFLAAQRRLGRQHAWRKLHEAALGLLFLHQKQIVHGDLKGDNILVAADGTAMLTDFGLSFSLQQSALDPTRPQLDGRLAAMRWRAPEYAGELSTAPSFAADVYSLGMCIVEAVTGEHPWANVAEDRAVRNLLRRGDALFRPDGMADAEWELVRSMTTREPALRLTLLDAVQRIRVLADEEASRELQAGTEHRVGMERVRVEVMEGEAVRS